MQRIIFSALAAAALGASVAPLAAQGSEPNFIPSTLPRKAAKPIDKYAVEITAPEYGAYVGSRIPLTAMVSRNGTEAPQLSVVWESSNPSVAWINPAGELTFLAEGKLTVTASHMSGTAKKSFVVVENPVRDVAFESAAPAVATVGEKVRVAAVATDDRKKPIADARVAYAVAVRGERRAEASIDDRGTFVAKQPGVYVVIAAFGGHAASTVVVAQGSDQSMTYASAGPVDTRGKKLKFDNCDYFSYAGTSIALVAKAGDMSAAESEAFASQLSWSTSDSAVAVVDARGTVHFRTSGKVKITARWGDAQATESFTVEKNPVKRMVMRSNAKDVRVGDDVKLSTEIWGMGGYKVQNLRVNYALVGGAAGASISEQGVFTATRPGTYTIVGEAGGLGEQLTVVVRETSVMNK